MGIAVVLELRVSLFARHTMVVLPSMFLGRASVQFKGLLIGKLTVQCMRRG